MSRHLFVERRAYRRTEQQPEVNQTAAEEQHDKDRRQEITDEVAELEVTTDEVLNDIDSAIAFAIGTIGVGAA